MTCRFARAAGGELSVFVEGGTVITVLGLAMIAGAIAATALLGVRRARSLQKA